MTGAFIYLTICSARNAITARARRLREPRYAIGLVFGAAYLFFFVGRSLFRAPRGGRVGGPLAAFLTSYSGGLEVVGAAVLLAIVALAWLFVGTSKPALTFTRPEIQFLFPAPVTRRELIHYKVIRSQLGAAFGSAIVTLIVHARDLRSAWPFFIGTWIVMVSVNLHLTGVSLRRQSLVEHGRHGVLYQWLPTLVIFGSLAMVAATVASDWPRLSSVDGPGALLREVERLGQGGVLRVMLFPLIALIRLPLSSSGHEFLRALPFASLVLMANYLWVLRSDAAFEESSSAFAERQAELRSSSSVRGESPARRLPQPFALPAAGRPEIAFLWKNLILVGRYVRAANVLRVAGAIVFAGVMMSRRREAADMLATFSVFSAAVATMIGPQWTRNDLRQDLRHLTTLRTWPLSGATIVRGEVLAPTALLSAIASLFLIAAAAFYTGRPFGLTIPIASRMSYAIGALVVAPGIILTQVVAFNALAALFPAWMVAASSRSRGIDIMGQRILTGFGLMLTLAVALVPAVALAAIIGFGIRALTGIVPVVVPAIVVTAVLVIESTLVIEAIGRALDRADVTTLPPAQ